MNSTTSRPAPSSHSSTRSTNTTKPGSKSSVNSVATRLDRSTIFSFCWRDRKPMATVTGGAVVLHLGVPSTSSAFGPVRRRRTPSVRCASVRGAAGPRPTMEEDHYRTLRLAPGATRGEVKKAFHRLALQYHPDVLSRGDEDSSVDFQRINEAYNRVMANMREAEARLEYWRARYGLADEDLDRYRRYLHEDDQDDWFSDL